MARSKRKVDPDQQAADEQVAAELAADADKPHPAVDWRRTLAGGAPTKVARDNTPTEWQSFVLYPAATARLIAQQAAAAGHRNGNQWIKELVVAELHRRTGLPADEIRGFKRGPHNDYRAPRSATLNP